MFLRVLLGTYEPCICWLVGLLHQPVVLPRFAAGWDLNGSSLAGGAVSYFGDYCRSPSSGKRHPVILIEAHSMTRSRYRSRNRFESRQ